jgi:hypothetical protein
MGGTWLWMVVCLTLGLILWFAVGLGGSGLIAGVIPVVILRRRWDRLMRSYCASMLQSGKQSFSIRDWSFGQRVACSCHQTESSGALSN